MLKEKSKQNGITLIALIITIIIMLILVGVTVTFALKGELFEEVFKAKEKTEAAQNEETQLSDGRTQVDNVWYDSANDYLDKNPSVDKNEKVYNITVNIGGSVTGSVNNPTTISENQTVTLEYTGIVEMEDIVEFSVTGAKSNYYVEANTLYISLFEPTSDVVISVEVQDCCFVAGTKVWLADGTTKNIEDVLIGDIVMSYNELTKEYEPAKVTNRIVNPNTVNLARVNFEDGSSIEMNEYHPLYTKEGWKSLTNYNGLATLTKDDDVLSYNKFIEITSIDTWTVNEAIVSYNLSIENNHNYFVGDIPVLVHNASCPV